MHFSKVCKKIEQKIRLRLTRHCAGEWGVNFNVMCSDGSNRNVCTYLWSSILSCTVHRLL